MYVQTIELEKLKLLLSYWEKLEEGIPYTDQKYVNFWILGKLKKINKQNKNPKICSRHIFWHLANKNKLSNSS